MKTRAYKKKTAAGSFPMTILTVSLAVTMALFVVLGWLIWNSYKDFKTTQTRDFRLQELSDRIVHFDEVLTMSARMAAATGDLQWEERYRHYEPQLDTAIKEAKLNTPDAFVSEAAARTEAANIKLVALENQAFDLVRKGRHEDAMSLLSSEEYDREKQIYSQGIKEITVDLKKRAQSALAAQRQRGFIAVASVIVGFFVLFLIWFGALQIIERHIAERNRADEAMQKAHNELERRVIERTAELSKVNKELQFEIAGHKQTEEELRKSENKYRNLIETLPQKIFYKDKNSVYVYCNNNYARDLKINADEITGKTDYDFYPKELAEKYRAEDKNILDSGNTAYIEEKYWEDGKEMVDRKVKTPVEDEEGTAIGILGIFWDITQRKRAEEEKTRFESMLKDKVTELFIMNEICEVLLSTRELNEILHIILIGATSYQALGFNRAFLFLINQAGNILEGRVATGSLSAEAAYKTWETLSRDSYTLKELLISRHGELSKGDEPINNLVKKMKIPLQETDNIFTRAVIEEKSFNIINAISNQLIDKDFIRLLGTDTFALVPLISRGKTLGVLLADNFINKKPIDDEDVERLRAFANQASLAIENSHLYHSLQEKVAELSSAYNELRENRDKLLQSERLSAVGEVAAKVAHDIRNPLTAIGGFARRSLKKGHVEQLNQRYLGIIVKEIDRLEKILTDILDFTKPPVPKFAPVDLNNVIKSTFEILGLELEQNKIRFEEKLDPHLPMLQLDEDQIRRVFINFFINSIEAMPDGGVISVSTMVTDQWVKVETADTGIGIASADMTKLFVPFFSSKSTGSGLGLTLSAQVIKNHGGTIKVQQRKPKGTIFIIRLPISQIAKT
jgi:PAS domain S-box-containing protein